MKKNINILSAKSKAYASSAILILFIIFISTSSIFLDNIYLCFKTLDNIKIINKDINDELKIIFELKQILKNNEDLSSVYINHIPIYQTEYGYSFTYKNIYYEVYVSNNKIIDYKTYK